MNPENSLPSSQLPENIPYYETDESIMTLPIIFL